MCFLNILDTKNLPVHCSCLVHRLPSPALESGKPPFPISLLPNTHLLLLPSHGCPVPELAAAVQAQQASPHSHANLDPEGMLSLLRSWALSPPARYLLLAALPQPCSPAAGGAAFAAPFAAFCSGRTAPETNTGQDTGQSSCSIKSMKGFPQLQHGLPRQRQT